MSWKMYLDDERFPKTNECWAIVRSVKEAQALILANGFPCYISFDHDLGLDVPTGFDLAKWIVESDLGGDIVIPPDFVFNIHSANPVGRDNIMGLLTPYLKLKRLGDNR